MRTAKCVYETGVFDDHLEIHCMAYNAGSDNRTVVVTATFSRFSKPDLKKSKELHLHADESKIAKFKFGKAGKKDVDIKCECGIADR